MIRLYEGSGSHEIELCGALAEESWDQTRRAACALLRARSQAPAAELLEKIPFQLMDGTNSFSDEFCVLFLSATLAQYVDLAGHAEDPLRRRQYKIIADTVTEIGPYVRFVAVALDTKLAPPPVTSPSLSITSDAVERALADAEQLLNRRGAASGVDRVHTALHGYLRSLCSNARISVANDAGVTTLFKALRQGHPAFSQAGARQSDVDKIARALANVVDALDPLRNHASAAHPSAQVLDEPEAMLVINGVRTLLHYLNAKLA